MSDRAESWGERQDRRQGTCYSDAVAAHLKARYPPRSDRHAHPKRRTPDHTEAGVLAASSKPHGLARSVAKSVAGITHRRVKRVELVVLAVDGRLHRGDHVSFEPPRPRNCCPAKPEMLALPPGELSIVTCVELELAGIGPLGRPPLPLPQ